jgi:hypothetical protein
MILHIFIETALHEFGAIVHGIHRGHVASYGYIGGSAAQPAMVSIRSHDVLKIAITKDDKPQSNLLV